MDHSDFPVPLDRRTVLHRGKDKGHRRVGPMSVPFRPPFGLVRRVSGQLGASVLCRAVARRALLWIARRQWES